MEKEYKEFLSKIAQIELLSRQVKKSTQKEYDSLVENHQSLIENGMERHSKSMHNMVFQSLANGSSVFYDHMDLDFDHRLKDVVSRRNKHYLWLLAEAFECFEDFLELMYAHIGHKEPSAWPSKEFKDETPASLAGKPFEWFLKKSESNKRLSAKLECIRNRFPALAYVEKSNSFKIDFRFTICLIEMLRHIVVHNGGKVIDFEKFVARIFHQAGIANNGNYDREKLQQINDFIIFKDGVHQVIMLEFYHRGTPFHSERLGYIINCLLAYADHMYKFLIRPTYFPSVQA